MPCEMCSPLPDFTQLQIMQTVVIYALKNPNSFLTPSRTLQSIHLPQGTQDTQAQYTPPIMSAVLTTIALGFSRFISSSYLFRISHIAILTHAAALRPLRLRNAISFSSRRSAQNFIGLRLTFGITQGCGICLTLSTPKSNYFYFVFGCVKITQLLAILG